MGIRKSLLMMMLMGWMGCASSSSNYPVEDFQCYPESVYLFRHAEKQIIKGEKNPELTRDGFARSDALAEALKDVQNGVIYLAQVTGLPVVPLSFACSKKKSSRVGINSFCHSPFLKDASCGASLFGLSKRLMI